uniref:Uncharacterized protein n=1 Tax=Rhizophora mucronata TaxID=61149 RepID=A0A2P2J3H6_RHIMU
MWTFARGTCCLHWQLVQECQFVNWPRVHEEEYGVHCFPSSSRCCMEKAHPVVHGHRHDAVRQLCEECTESQ